MKGLPHLMGQHSYAGGHTTPLPLLLVTHLVTEGAFMCVIGSPSSSVNLATSLRLHGNLSPPTDIRRTSRIV